MTEVESQAHPGVVEKLRTSQPGQLTPPIFLKNIRAILRLDSWEGARLDENFRQQMLNEQFNEWLKHRAGQLLAGEVREPLPVHRLHNNLT